MFTNRATAICLLEVLKEYSDENHILPMREVVSHMNRDYGLSPDRRTIYDAIELLKHLGYEISRYEDNGIGYYLQSRVFEQGEIRLLSDAIYSCKSIPKKYTDTLIEKLQGLSSRYDRRKIQHLRISDDSRKTPNKQLFLNIELLDEAIEKGVKVSFVYLHYDTKGELVARREKKYTVAPFGLVFTNEHYYLVCCADGKEKTSLYRIDKMKEIEYTDNKIDDHGKDFSPNAEVNNAVYAFTGKSERVEMLIDKHILDDVIDKFGRDVRITDEDDRYRISFTATPSGVRFWAMQYLPYVEVTKPTWVREMIVDGIKKNRYITVNEELEND